MGMPESGNAIEVEVVRIDGGGVCPHGLEVGDSWTIDSGVVPAGFCGSAYHVLFPYLNTLRFGGDLPWEEECGEATISCPDAANQVIFKMVRIGEGS